MNLLDHYAEQLDQLRQQGNFRQFRSNQHHGKMIEIQQQHMLNLSSNDYLGLASDLRLREQFFDETPNTERLMSASSSRLLTGNFPAYEQLEAELSQLFHGRAALLFTSGYHMNIGILPALLMGFACHLPNICVIAIMIWHICSNCSANIMPMIIMNALLW